MGMFLMTCYLCIYSFIFDYAILFVYLCKRGVFKSMIVNVNVPDLSPKDWFSYVVPGQM